MTQNTITNINFAPPNDTRSSCIVTVHKSGQSAVLGAAAQIPSASLTDVIHDIRIRHVTKMHQTHVHAVESTATC